MKRKLAREDWLDRRLAGWRDAGGRWVTGLTLFLTVTGLAIFGLPFGVFNQHGVLLHTAVGLVFLLPLCWYLVRHVAAYWEFPLTHIKVSGYLAGAMTLACSASGVMLTYESVLGTRITYLWRTVHIVTTFGLILFLAPHLIALAVRNRSESAAEVEAQLSASAGGHARLALGASVALLLLTGALTVAVRPVTFDNAFPAEYDLSPYENAGPFSPSLATTTTGGAFDSHSLSGSESCGTSGCHEQIYKEWLPSSHRWAAMDLGFQAIQGVMAEQNGPVTTRYCGGCHDPISLFSGTKNIGIEDLTGLAGYQEGISCLACHAIEQTDVQGNANYVIHQPQRYVWELREGRLATFLSDFLIRAYPQKHIDTFSRRMFKTPEFCAACHKQFIDEEVNDVGWVQLQNQYDNWRASRWNHPGTPERTLECRECHMPLVDSRDPAAGDEADFNRTARDKKHRSHRFLGANQVMPLWLKIEGAQEHAELTERWLKGEIPVPEIAGRWTEGPAVPIELEAPETVRPGEPISLRVQLINNKAGHDFPTGPLDIIQAWVEIEVKDGDGQVVFHSGRKDERHFIEPGTFMFKAEPVDRYGNLIDRHNLWEMVGVRFKRSLFPGSAEATSFTFDCPGAALDKEVVLPGTEPIELEVPASVAGGVLNVVARLNYRKFDQYLLNFMFGEDSGLTSPVTTVSEARATIQVGAAGY